MKILHLADVHLDRPFAGLTPEARARRRANLLDAFRRCIALARERDVDLLTIGGDLWEHEHLTPNTRNSVIWELGQFGKPTLVICGNHDPFVPGCGYELAEWPANVTVVRTSDPEPHEFEGVCVWGVSWTSGQLSTSFLDTFQAPSDGRVHLLLFHGTSGPLAHLTEDAACTFQRAQITKAGFDRCLAGHVHIASDDGMIVYPGSPEPLRWNETDRHCVALVEVVDGRTSVDLINVNRFSVEEREADCTGAASSAELEDRVRKVLDHDDQAHIYLRLTLVGEIGADCAVDVEHLTKQLERYGAVAVDNHTAPLLDIGGRAERPGLDGLFVRKLKERIDVADDGDRHTLELALEAGLRAIDGRQTVLHVD